MSQTVEQTGSLQEEGTMHPLGRDGLFSRFTAAEEGATAIEYALIASAVGAAVATTVWALGSEVKTSLFQKVANALGV